jgi:hypothetical protein
MAMPYVDMLSRVREARNGSLRDAAELLQSIVEDKALAPFASRSAALAWITANPEPVAGTVVQWDGIGVRYVSAETDVIDDMPGWAPDGPVTPKHFGALGDGATDDVTPMARPVMAQIMS